MPPRQQSAQQAAVLLGTVCVLTGISGAIILSSDPASGSVVPLMLIGVAVLLGSAAVASQGWLSDRSLLMVLAAFVLIAAPASGAGDASWAAIAAGDPLVIGDDPGIWLSSPGGMLLVILFVKSSFGLLGYQLLGVALFVTGAIMLLAQLAPNRGRSLTPTGAAIVLVLVSMPLTAWFRSTRFEATTWAPGLALVALALALGATQRNHFSAWVSPGFVAGLAFAVHPAAFPALLPAALLVFIWPAGTHAAPRGRALRVTGFVIAAIGAAALVMFCAWATGRGFKTGDATGGGGGIMADDFWSTSQWARWSTAVFIAGGTAAFGLVTGALALMGPSGAGAAPSNGRLRGEDKLLAAAALCALVASLVIMRVWEFDLGWTLDADLIGLLGMGLPVAAVLGIAFSSAERDRRVAVATVCMAAAVFVGSLAAAAWTAAPPA